MSQEKEASVDYDATVSIVDYRRRTPPCVALGSRPRLSTQDGALYQLICNMHAVSSTDGIMGTRTHAVLFNAEPSTS